MRRLMSAATASAALALLIWGVSTASA
ncbi:MAG: hypothetical protein QOJ92_329, partial [Frankiales bacterium]|nr:hypothetical protein [Frankiales bacterium]